MVACLRSISTSCVIWPSSLSLANAWGMNQAKLLTALFGSARPLSSTSCIVPDAWMTFDFRGLAFLEPCYTSAIVRGVSDVSWEGESEEEYKRWVWDRCSPQLKYDGEYPPSLEVSPSFSFTLFCRGIFVDLFCLFKFIGSSL